MLAIPISSGIRATAKVLGWRYIRRISGLLGLAACAGLMCIDAGCFLTASGQAMASDASAPADFAARTRKEFNEAKNRFQTETNNAEAAWQFGRACFDLAESATNKAERARLAQNGIAACRQSISRNPASAPAHYYLGMNLGQLADTKRNLAALRMVKEIEREFQAACNLDERFDYAGPDRNLGLLYMQAPVIGSIGSRSKAHQHLRRAVELAPEYPENRLDLIEACWKWGELNVARHEIKTLEELWPGARQKFTGETWAASWRDWEKRSKAAKRKLEQASRPLESPHHQE